MAVGGNLLCHVVAGQWRALGCIPTTMSYYIETAQNGTNGWLDGSAKARIWCVGLPSFSVIIKVPLVSLVIKPTTIAQIQAVIVSENLNDGWAVEKPVTVVPPIVDPVRKIF